MYIVSSQRSSDFSSKMSARSMSHLSPVEKKRFPDGELYIRILDNLQDQDVAVVGNTRSEEDILELLFLLNAAKEQNPKSITAVVPFFGYARQHMIYRRGEAISSKVIIQAISQVAERIITVDIHDTASFIFTDRNCINFSPVEAIAKSHRKDSISMVVAPDDGAFEKAKAVGKALSADSMYLVKTRTGPTTVEYDMENLNVKGMNVLVVDDIISTGGTVMKTIEILKSNGAAKVFVAATHGIFLNGSAEKIRKMCDRLSTTDTIVSDYSTINISMDVMDYIGESK
ncbi:MAG: ribose-phosphate diphosphokinase [Candidatus Thermoplasmatota archaeon]|nr:ribose-phosphate diphosphokinase [Candidatus Thermoplasmatota archaeon]